LLQSGIALAGAKTVLVALWPIDDRLTVPFVKRFYRTGMTPVEALQKTKLLYITSPNASEHDPATWALFVLYEG